MSLKLVYFFCHISYVVPDTCPTQPIATFALAVPSQSNGIRAITMLCEIGKKMFLPTPCSMPSTMYKEKRGWMWIGCRFAQHGYRSYAIGLRGHGKSEGGDRLRWTGI